MHPLYPSPRVSQLDSHILDGELFSLLKQQLADAFEHLTGLPWSYSQQPELWSLFLKLLVFKLTIWKSGSTYGLKLQNLKLSTSKTGRSIGKSTKLLFLAIIFGEFGFQKLQSYLYSTDERVSNNSNSFMHKMKSFLLLRKMEVLKTIDGIVKVLKLANFVSFLVYGKFPTLIHRALGVSLTPIVADLLKFHGDNVNFEFQNRQLVWNVMTEFLVFILPLLQINKAKKSIKKFIVRAKGKEATAPNAVLLSRFSHLPVSQCAICIENKEIRGIKVATTQVTNPFVTNCGHIFCYICLATRFNSMDNDVEGAELCPRCNTKLTNFKDYASDVLDIDKSVIIVPYQEIESDDELESKDENEKTVDGPAGGRLASSISALEAEADEMSDTDEELLEAAYDDDLDDDDLDDDEDGDSFDDYDEDDDFE